jgi:hypothetical protein
VTGVDWLGKPIGVSKAARESPMTILRDDIAAFEKMRAELEAAHAKEWVVIHGGELQGVFNDFEEAATLAVERFGSGACLIRQIGAPAAIQLPGGMIFTPSHALSASRV